MMALYSFALSLALLLAAPWWTFRMLTTGRFRAGLVGRLGWLPDELRAISQQQNVIWLHAVSVGEVLAATELVRELQRRLPEWTIAISTTTATGLALARARFPDTPVFFVPLDFGFAVRRYLGALHPRMLVLMESELWPRLLYECGRRCVPVVVVNARMSDRSFRRSFRVRQIWKFALQRVTAFLAQGEETAARLRQLGAPPDRISVVGNLKFDLRAPVETFLVCELRSRLPGDARVLVCGSTLEGEELLLLKAWQTVAVRTAGTPVMVLAPRHPERFSAVERMVRETGCPMLRASDLATASRTEIPSGAVVLLDTIGDLAAVYSIGSAAFVGGSLVSAGGHNPLEPARFGVPVTMGRSIANFREIVALMQTVDAIRLVDAEQVPEVLYQSLAKEPAIVAMGERGRALFAANTGATKRTVERLLELLDAVDGGMRPA